MEKLLTNGMSCSPLGDIGETGLFVTMSRMYHECLANADHQYLENRGVKIVVAARSISPGDQITIAYVTGSNPGRRMKLQSQYGFVCHCRACSYASIEAKLTKAIRLDSAILDAGSMGQPHMALQKGRALLSIYDDLGISDWLYMRTYYDLYQVTITKRKYLRDGRHYISKAYEAVLAYTGDAEHPEVTRLKTLVADPSSHRNYVLLEGK